MSTIITAESARNYIKNLDIPTDKEVSDFFKKHNIVKAEADDVPANEDNKNSAVVDAGSLISFTDKLTGLQKEDVQNSTLLAQLAANTDVKKKGGTRESMVSAWYDKYIEVLNNIGWIITGFAMHEYKTKDDSFTLDKAVLDIAEAVASGNELKMMTATMGALGSLADESGQMNLFNKSSTQGGDSNFQIAPCDVGNDGSVIMILTGTAATSKIVSTRFLWIKRDKKETSVHASANKVVLNEKVYAYVRDDIITKLAGHGVDYVRNLDVDFDFD